ncbi:variable charge X-linked protein 1-like [Crassostrea angulata]|uniref:variable charge X-linked protein 1-like n=1 Tax=Magallana angulata TaxID=2784310 RepID=UPI0022B0AC52|nr:variable charge X-linked protein 1-like [Crassostrea angulata]
MGMSNADRQRKYRQKRDASFQSQKRRTTFKYDQFFDRVLLRNQIISRPDSPSFTREDEAFEEEDTISFQSYALSSEQQQPCALSSEQQQPCALSSEQQQPCALSSEQQQPCALPSEQQEPCALPSEQQEPCALPSEQQDPCAFPSEQQEPCAFLDNSSVQQSASALHCKSKFTVRSRNNSGHKMRFYPKWQLGRPWLVNKVEFSSDGLSFDAMY